MLGSLYFKLACLAVPIFQTLALFVFLFADLQTGAHSLRDRISYERDLLCRGAEVANKKLQLRQPSEGEIILCAPAYSSGVCMFVLEP